MPETSDELAYAMYAKWREMRQIKTPWGDLSSNDKNVWRALAVLAMEFMIDLVGSEEETVG